jgi:endonuclease-8
MPEGDTVWLAARRLDDAMSGHHLTASDFRIPSLATVDLAGRRVSQVRSYGKHLLFRLEDDLTLHTHFRMQGTWHLYRPGRPWHGGPEWEIRAVLSTADWQAVGYRIPVIELIPTAEESSVVGHLGPDILEPDVDIDDVVRRLEQESDRAIGDAMLDQTIVAGFGLIYVSEGLFLHGVSPRTPVRDVPNLTRLVDRTRRLMAANRERGAQTSTGSLREQHYVYGRAKRPCRRCGTSIRFGRQRSGRYERDAYWCPHCQPG